MKVAILAGARGSRLPEAVQAKSKAMVPIGDLPSLWHIMKYYSQYGFHDFVVALGDRADSIRGYFTAKAVRQPSRVNGERIVVYPAVEPDWTLELVDTELDIMSGGRIKRLAPYLDGQPDMLTWCDGLAAVRLDGLLEFHQQHGRISTLTAVHPPGRFGRLDLSGDRIVASREKVEGSERVDQRSLVRLQCRHSCLQCRHSSTTSMTGRKFRPERNLASGQGALETVGVSDARPADR